MRWFPGTLIFTCVAAMSSDQDTLPGAVFEAWLAELRVDDAVHAVPAERGYADRPRRRRVSSGCWPIWLSESEP